MNNFKRVSAKNLFNVLLIIAILFVMLLLLFRRVKAEETSYNIENGKDYILTIIDTENIKSEVEYILYKWTQPTGLILIALEDSTYIEKALLDTRFYVTARYKNRTAQSAPSDTAWVKVYGEGDVSPSLPPSDTTIITEGLLFAEYRIMDIRNSVDGWHSGIDGQGWLAQGSSISIMLLNTITSPYRITVSSTGRLQVYFGGQCDTLQTFNPESIDFNSGGGDKELIITALGNTEFKYAIPGEKTVRIEAIPKAVNILIDKE